MGPGKLGVRSKLSILLVASSTFLVPFLFNACSGGAQSPVDFSVSSSAGGFGGNCPPPTTMAPQAIAPGEQITYDQHVKPLIFQRVCLECHGAIPGLPNWMDYNQAYAKRDVILFRVTNKIMPPPNAKIPTLTADEIDLVQRWVAAGAPKGTGAGPVAGGGDCPPTDGSGGGTPDDAPPVILDPAPPANPTYEADLKPKMFTPICGACHGVRPDLPNWQDYAEASDEADKIKRKVQEGEMPPPSSGIKLTDNQKELIYRWVDQGARR